MTFAFTRNGVTFRVCTHVGNGSAVVDVKALPALPPKPTTRAAQ